MLRSSWAERTFAHKFLFAFEVESTGEGSFGHWRGRVCWIHSWGNKSGISRPALEIVSASHKACTIYFVAKPEMRYLLLSSMIKSFSLFTILLQSSSTSISVLLDGRLGLIAARPQCTAYDPALKCRHRNAEFFFIDCVSHLIHNSLCRILLDLDHAGVFLSSRRAPRIWWTFCHPLHSCDHQRVSSLTAPMPVECNHEWEIRIKLVANPQL